MGYVPFIREWACKRSFTVLESYSLKGITSFICACLHFQKCLNGISLTNAEYLRFGLKKRNLPGE